MSCSLLEQQICEMNPQFSHNVNCIYNKDAIVIKNGVIYVSLKDCNMANLEDVNSWDKLDIKAFKNKVGVDSAPVGTILSVPKNTAKFGYIDYVEGKTFNKILYPKLYNLFGSNVFPPLDDANVGDNLPLGSIIYVMDDEAIPNGWVKWEVKANNLAGTDLLKLFKKLSRNTTDSNVKQLFDNAIANNTFPDFEDFFLRAGVNANSVIGSFVSDSVAFNASFKVLPLVISDDVLNPVACSTNNKPVSANIIDGEVNVHACESSCEVTAGIKGIKLKSGCDKAVSTKYSLSGNGTETVPKHLVTYIAVKVMDKVTKASGNFKQIIKGYDTLDADVESVVLKFSDILKEFTRQTEEMQSAIEALKDDLTNKLKLNAEAQGIINSSVNEFIKNYNESNLEGKLGNGLKGKGTLSDKLGLKVNESDFTFDPDGSLKLVAKTTQEVLNLNKAVPTLGMSSFHGFVNNKVEPNKFVIGVPKDINIQNSGFTSGAASVTDLVGSVDYDFIGYQLASSVEVMQYFINDGVTFVRSNDAGMNENGILNDINRWSDWRRTDNAQIPFDVINNHTNLLNNHTNQLAELTKGIANGTSAFNQALEAVKTTFTELVEKYKQETGNNIAGLNQANATLSAALQSLQNSFTNQESELDTLKKTVEAFKTKLETPCTIGLKTVSDYTVENSDNTLLCSGGTISIPNNITVGRMFNLIATTANKVTLVGTNGMTLIPPANGSLVLAEKDTIVTVIITAPNEGRLFGQTE